MIYIYICIYIYVYIYTYIYISCITLMTLDYGNHGIFLIVGNAGCISSTVSKRPFMKSCSFLLECTVTKSQWIGISAP